MVGIFFGLLGFLAGAATGFAWRAKSDQSKAHLGALDDLRAVSKAAREAATEERRAWTEHQAFSAGLLRELRTPIRGVLGLADSLVSGEDVISSRVQMGLHAIVATGKSIDRMVSDVTECRRMEDLHMDLAPVDLHAAVSEVMIVLAPLAGEKTLELVNDVSMNFPIARGDETRIAQVLVHLIGNALESTQQGVVRIGAERVAGKLRVSVTDTGPGLSESALAKVFDEREAPRGMAFVRKLVELQSGEVSATSERGHGSTFAFTLPEAGPGAQRRGHVNVRTLSSRAYQSSIPVVNRALARVLKHAPSSVIRLDGSANTAPPNLESSRFSLRQKAPLALLAELDIAPSSSHLSAPPPSSSGIPSRPSFWATTVQPKVLHIADEVSAIEAFEGETDSLGCLFDHALTEADALSRLARDPSFAAVVVDLRSARTNLVAFARDLRKHESAALLPLVFVIDASLSVTPEALFSAGANDVIVRPYAATELVERLRSQIAVARLSRAAQRVVPREFLALLGCTSFDELSLGTCVEREMSVLFADLQGFTKASERMTSRQVFAWLNDRFGAVVPALRANGGFVDKFIGDAVMALFADGPAGALRAAIEAAHAMRAIDPVNRLGIGVHHGPTMIGTLGERERFSPTVVSDTVNVAARLESLTRRFESSALVSEETLNQVDAAVRPSTRYLGAFRVKGRGKALRIHELLDAEEAELSAKKRAAGPILEQVIQFVGRGDLENASRAASIGAAEHPEDRTLAFYIIELDRIARRESNFDGVIALQEK